MVRLLVLPGHCTAEAAEWALRRSHAQDEPSRTASLGREQLEHHARRLADRQRTTVGSRRHRLLDRLDENACVLQAAHRLLSAAAAEGRTVAEGGIWLLDNDYLVRDQIRTARRELPRKYRAELPRLCDGPWEDYPRVYELALELLVHLDGQLDQDNLHGFLRAYQSVCLLELGELWALPSMLRLAGIENLRRLALQVAWRQQDVKQGEQWAERMGDAAAAPPTEIERAWRELLADQRPLTSGFIAGFTQRLSACGGQRRSPVIEWLAQYLAERGETIEEAVSRDAHNQAADESAMRSGILSLRALGTLDWNRLVEDESAVEQILRSDPAGVYGRMDLASRDCYRRVVERLANRSPLSEKEVAQRVVEHARRAEDSATAAGRSPTRREAVVGRHVGYFLVDGGLALLEKSISYRATWQDVLGRLAARAPLACYLGGILSLWLLTLAGAAAAAWRLGIASLASPAVCAVLLVLFAGAASQFAVSLVNWLCALLVPPRPLVRLDFSHGIPADNRTLVAVPAMLTNARGVHGLMEQLELRYLANRDDNLLFALLTDFCDAPRETIPGDRRLLLLARTEIERLNRRYRRSGHGPFYFLHRPRKWNGQQGVWMGEERKRGKLAALNELLRTGSGKAFSVMVGDLPQLAAIRYVITLDTDTRLPPQAGRQLVACMAHPLNWPEIDPATRTVTAGYALLQPRVGTAIAEASRSLFSGLLAGDAGIDPYTRQTSEVYHDVFARGSFIGKGIYDVEAFDRVMGRRFPPNRILSHDLIEGCFARSGLINDVELLEGVPAGLLADACRRHRWIRGDWQIAAWLWPRVPTVHGWEANPLDGLSRWKIFDNLRRSLTPIFLLGFLLAGWLLAPAMAGCWMLLALATAFVPALLGGLPGFFRKPREKPWRLHFEDQGLVCLRALGMEAVSWCILPHVAYAHADAIARTLYRLHVSHRKLLEWTTASDSERRCPDTCGDHYLAMWLGTASGSMLAAWLAADPLALLFAAPALACWLAGPLLAWWISRPRGEQFRLDDRERQQFRRWARQTWHYFEEFVAEQHHWLPPDNVQECPRWMMAERTSPTNIAMGLLADLAAHDLGYLSAAAWLERAGHTLETMAKLPRHRGHFFNWYDTRTLQPPEPRYVSSVDSGNLWGAFAVLQVGLQELRQRPLVPPRFLEGLQDTLAVIASLRAPSPRATTNERFDACLAQLQAECRGPFPGGARRACRLLCRIRARAANLAIAAAAESPDVQQWCLALVRQCAVIHRDLARLAFWTRVPKLAGPVAGGSDSNGHSVRSANGRSPPFLAPRRGRDGDGLRSHGAGQQVMTQSPPAVVTEEEQVVFRQLRDWTNRLDRGCTLEQLAVAARQVSQRIARLLDDAAEHEAGEQAVGDFRLLFVTLRRAAERAALAAREQLRQIAHATRLCRRFSKMDFRFLYDPQRKLLSIGFNVSHQLRDDSYYDLLASEARLTSFMAISHRQLPLEHWFALSRTVALADAKPVLLSWSGSMFEYLMPMLLMPSFRGTMLDGSCRRAVARQIRYAHQRQVPWGMSESCHRLTDEHSVYQYRAFGVPGLGMMRGLADHLVVAPYASALAAMIAPHEACQNLERLERAGHLSPRGFYDAIDYAGPRNPAAGEPPPCRTVMAHHSGMAILALANVLLDGPMPRRFLTIAPHAAYDVLLQERLPQVIHPVDPLDEASPPPPPTPRTQPVGGFVVAPDAAC